jgi:hypothetical protein
MTPGTRAPWRASRLAQVFWFFFSKKEQNCFFEKKKQKTFVCLGLGGGGVAKR